VYRKAEFVVSANKDVEAGGDVGLEPLDDEALLKAD